MEIGEISKWGPKMAVNQTKARTRWCGRLGLEPSQDFFSNVLDLKPHVLDHPCRDAVGVDEAGEEDVTDTYHLVIEITGNVLRCDEDQIT